MPRRLDASLSDVAPRSTAQRNFSDIWAGSSTQPYDYATALLKVIYCFRGYSTANQVLSDVKNPVRTLKIAAPIALSLVSIACISDQTSPSSWWLIKTTSSLPGWSLLGYSSATFSARESAPIYCHSS